MLLQMQVIKIYEGKTIHEIALKRISHFMAMGNKTHVVLEDNSVIVSTRILKFYHDQLHIKAGFYRVHRKYLINVAFVKELQDGKYVYYAKDNFTKPYPILPTHIN